MYMYIIMKTYRLRVIINSTHNERTHNTNNNNNNRDNDMFNESPNDSSLKSHFSNSEEVE